MISFLDSLFYTQFKSNGFANAKKMNAPNQKKKVLIKTSYQYLVRAKLYGVVTLNCLEGMMNELDELIPVDMEKGKSIGEL